MASIYTQENGSFIVTNEHYALGYQAYGELAYATVAGSAARTVADAQLFPLDAIVEKALFSIVAKAPRNVSLANVAEIEVRSGQGATIAPAPTAAVVVDFGTLTTVKDLNPGAATATAVYMWTGTDWKRNLSPAAEFASQRVLLEFGQNVTAAQVKQNGSVTLPAAPGNLELLLDGVAVWTNRQGGEEITNGWLVDKTDLVRQTLTRLKSAAQVGETAVSLRVELRSDVLADLTLAPDIDVSRVHRVVFPNGPSRSVDNAAEGPVAIVLPLPEPSTTWSVDVVQVRTAASVGPERVQPAQGPGFTSSAKLCMAPGRSVLMRLPDVLVSRFDSIRGIRIPIAADGGAGEIGGRLLGVNAGDDGPGEPIEGAVLAPVAVPAGETQQWTTLELPEGLDASLGPFWIELIVSYGDLVCALTHNDDTDVAAPGALVHHRLPGGGSRPLTQFRPEELGALFGTVRIVGEADPNAPIAALTLNVEHPATGALDPTVEVGVTPTSDGADVYLKLQSPAKPQTPSLQLVGATAVGGAFTFDKIDVIYREEDGS